MWCRIAKVVGVVFMLTGAAGALAATTGETIFIESDSLDIDEGTGLSVYRGNVIFRQGASQVWADVVTVHSRGRKEVEKIVATGKPARFQYATPDKPEVTQGSAEMIEYYDIQGLVVLDGNAQLTQGKNVFAGNRIEYEVNTKVVRAGQAASGDGKGRVVVTIQPQQEDAPGNDKADDKAQ